MPDTFKGLTDQWGRPIEKAALTQEIAAATLTGVRTPVTGYPGDGLTPERLGQILREADGGDPLRYLELAETAEERDPHYTGVLGTRKRSVAQLDITVEAGSEDSAAEEQAETVRRWLKRDELCDELFDMLDAIGKGYSFTEIIWDSSEGQWRPERLEWRDPRWFRFERGGLTAPVLIGEGGQDEPLPGFKFIRATMKAKSGLALRSGIARVALWAWMFKMYTNRDWAVFTQTHGQPVRIGKYGPGATEADRMTLYRAVANIAGDCAAIIPESMAIEFVEAKTAGTSMELYEKRADWLDRQISKLVLGQTATTDAIAGGHAVGREHRQVQEDIERADARALSAIVNRDLIRPWMTLEYGPQTVFPRVTIGRPEQKDVRTIVDAVTRLVPMGMKAGQKQMRDLIGIGEPDPDDVFLAPPVSSLPPETGGASLAGTPDRRMAKKEKEEDEQDEDKDETATQGSLTQPGDLIAGTLAGRSPQAALLDEIRAMVEKAESLEQLKAMLEAAAPDPASLAAAMKQALLVAELTGRAEIGVPASERSEA